MTQSTRKWKEDLKQIFSASVNQQTLEEAAELMVSVSATDSTYHEECIRALEEGIRAARGGDMIVIGIINTSGYRVRSADNANELLTDFLRIYLAEFARVTGRVSTSH